MRILFACLLIVGCKETTADKAVATSSQNTDAIAKLRRAIGDRYSYRDRLGLDWTELFAEAMPELERATSREQLVEGFVKVLEHAKDPHLTFVIDGKYIKTDPAKPAWNFAVAQIQKKVTDWKYVGRCLSIGRVGTFAYVLVNGLEKGKCDNLPRDWATAFAEVRNAPGMIMDLRGNGGGDELKAQAIAGYFIDKPTPYVKSETRDPTSVTGFAPAIERVVQPVAGIERYARPVVVLSGPLIMSSAESFLLMMRAAGATLVGGRSRGSSGNPQPVELGNGITLLVPSWRAMFVDGTYSEGVGIGPDVEVPVTAEEVATGDKVIDAAIVELTKRTK